MAVTKITWENKEGIQNDGSIARKNKVMDDDMNEIKQVVNNNADELNIAQSNIEDLQSGQSTSNADITNIKNIISTLETDNKTNKSDISALKSDNTTNKENISTLQEQVSNKVDKVEGKGLSTNDYTTEEKQKLAGLKNYDDTEVKKDITDLKEENETQETSIEELQENLKNTKNELSDAQQEIDALRTIQNALPTVDGEGENVKLVGTAENTTFKKFKICGNSRQESREGYNLLDMRDAKGGTSGGITVTINEDGSYKYVGTATSNVINVWLKGSFFGTTPLFTLKAGKKYYIKDVLLYNLQTPVGTTGGAITPSSDIDVTAVRVPDATSGNTYDKTCYPMLTKDEEKDWQPYGVMPSPDFPAEIECVGDDVNLYNENAEKTDYYIADNGSEYVGVNNDIFTKQIISENLEKQYTMSFEKNNSANVRFAYYNEDTFISREVSNVNKHTFTVPDNCTKIDIRVDEVSGSGKYFEKLKIQKGSTATAYSKFGEGTVSTIISNKNLRNNGENYENWRPTSTSDGTITYNSKGFKVTTEGGNSRLINLRELPHLEDGKTYILSYKVTELPSGKGVQARYIKNDGTEEYGGAVTQSGKIGKLTITDTDIKTLTIFGQSGISGSFAIEDIQIEENTTSTDYVEHQEQNFTMPVQREMLEEDYFDLDTLEEVHNWNEIDISTLLSKDIAIGSASTDEYYVFQIPLCSETQRAKEVLCEKFKFLGFETASVSRKEEGITINTDAKRFGRVWIKASRLSEKSISAFLNWCSEENIIAKALIEDVETRLPMTAEQITIAKQIKNTLISYKDTTHVYSEDKISPIFKCSAIADMTAMLDNLQAQILAEEV